MTVESKSGGTAPGNFRRFALAALVLAVVLATLFRNGLVPNRTVFSNDGPLGQISADFAAPVPALTGNWQDLNWLGNQNPTASPTLSIFLSVLTWPITFSKLFAPFSLWFVGISAWFCFRQWKFTPLACLLGGIAAALNGDFLPTACWGVCAQPIAFGFSYLALGALADVTSPKCWMRIVLAGLAVGMNVMEAYDIGALFSIAVAAFVMFQALTGEGSPAKKIITGGVRVAIVAVFAGLVAAATLHTLINTQIKSVGGMAQDTETKAARWDEATMWSLPKSETLGIAVPGLFGLRMSPPPSDASHYWGAIGRHPSWDRWFKNPDEPHGGPIRYGGGSGYAGALVVVVIFWALFQSFRKTGSAFSVGQRRMIWFWAGLALVSLLLAFGRFAPFYQFFYAMPYASTIRNPTKFLHTLEWALVILFAFGVDALSRNFLKSQVAVADSWKAQWSAWRAKASIFDRRWFMGSLVALGGGLVALLLYASSTDKLAQYLQTVGFNSPNSPMLAKEIAQFSVRQAGWAILLYGIAFALVLLVIAGCFNGKRARLGGIVLGVFLTLDLAIYAGLLSSSANHWVVTYNWKDWLESHPVIDYLKKDAYQHRVTVVPFNTERLPREMNALVEQYDLLRNLYGYQWTQHQFPHHNIRTADMVQDPRPGKDKLAYMVAMSAAGQVRGWELTGTSRFLGPVALLQLLNQHPQYDAKLQRFRIATRFDIARKPNANVGAMGDPITTIIQTNGQYAVFEFAGALPSAKLYSRWETATNDAAALKEWVKGFEGRVPREFYNSLAGLADGDLATLKKLGAPDFDPMQTVLISGDNSPPASSVVATNQNAGTVEYVSYTPKRIVLHAKAATPTVLLLNDRYNPGWRVTVDGKPAPLLRCNFIVRGVHLSPGEHSVEFSFSTPNNTLYVTLAAIGLGLLLLGFLGLTRNRNRELEKK